MYNKNTVYAVRKVFKVCVFFFKIMYNKKYIVLTTTQKSHPHYL